MKNPDKSPLTELILDYAHLSFLSGIITGIESAATTAIEKSGELFAEGNDQRAGLTRTLGYDLRKKAKDMRQTQGTKREQEMDRIYSEILGHLEVMVVTKKVSE